MGLAVDVFANNACCSHWSSEDNRALVFQSFVPTSVKALSKYRVLHISMGLTHSAVVVEPCHVITFGQNSEGQLGIGNAKTQYVIVEVKALLDKHVTVNRRVFFPLLRICLPLFRISCRQNRPIFSK